MGSVAPRGEEHEALPGPPAVGVEIPPVDMAENQRVGDIVHSSPPESAVGQVEPRRADDVDRNAEAGGEPQDVAGVLRDVGLVERQRDGLAAIGGVHCPVPALGIGEWQWPGSLDPGRDRR